MPMVATGEQNYPVVTTSDTAQILAKDAAETDAADATITAHTISPTRLQRSYVFRREDQAVLSGLEEALRSDLSMAVSDLLDRQVLGGDGTTGAEFAGFLATAANGGIADRSDTPARVTFALAAAETARGIDGKFAGSLSECAVVMGDDTARDLASKFQNQRQRLGARLYGPHDHADDGERERAGHRVDVPRGHPCPHGRGGRERDLSDLGLHVHGARRRSPAGSPVRIAITIGMLAGFDILRASGFAKAKIQGRVMSASWRRSSTVSPSWSSGAGGAAIEGVRDAVRDHGADCRCVRRDGRGGRVRRRGRARRDPQSGCTCAPSPSPAPARAASRSPTASTELRLKAEIPEYRADIRDMVSRGILAGFSVSRCT